MSLQLPSGGAFLITRTDSIGDVMLTIPLTYFLKKHFPQHKILFLCSAYTKPLLEHIQTIDTVIELETFFKKSSAEQYNLIRGQNVHTAILVFPTYSVSKLLRTLSIPNRIGTAHRWYNWLFCNYRVAFSRKKSDLHEAQLNFKLLKPLGITTIPALDELQSMFLWKPLPALPEWIERKLNKNKFKLILHPKSKGSAREWGTKNFIQLIKHLNPSDYQIILTGTQQEEKYLQEIIQHCPEVTNFAGKTTLLELLALIQQCDGLVAASTGTLHIAAALGKQAIGIYPSIRPMHAGRWRPIGPNAYVIQQPNDCTDCKNTPEHCHCIQSISYQQVLNILNNITLQK